MLTQEERAKLAEFMGWRRLPAEGVMNQDFYENKHEQFMCWAEVGFRDYPVWLTDTESPTGLHQIFGPGGLVEKVREKGYELQLGYGYTIQGILAWVKFRKESYESYHHAPTIGLATVKAILAMIEKEEV